MNTPTPRTDAAWTSSFEGKQLSAGQTARALRECSQKLETELAALRAENATLRAAQKACEACDEPTAFEVRQLRAELTAEREKSERYRLATLKLDAELAAERARLDAGTILLTVAGERVWHCGVDLRAAIDAAMKEAAK
jgi:hypothetical protein